MLVRLHSASRLAESKTKEEEVGMAESDSTAQTPTVLTEYYATQNSKDQIQVLPEVSTVLTEDLATEYSNAQTQPLVDEAVSPDDPRKTLSFS